MKYGVIILLNLRFMEQLKHTWCMVYYNGMLTFLLLSLMSLWHLV